MKPNRKLILPIAIAVANVLVLPAGTGAAEKRVCVDVVVREVNVPIKTKTDPPTSAESPSADSPKAEESPEPLKSESPKRLPWEVEAAKTETAQSSLPDQEGSLLPIGQTPVVYLKRLIEHFITHEVGYEAVAENCEERLRVEIYPLQEGWTVFARSSGNGREERVDQLFPDELSQFAERVALALLYDMPISATINRDNVLRSDSKKSVQRIKGSNHFVIGLGTQLRGGKFATAAGDATGSAPEELRLFSPMTISTGYRGKFENWGIEVITQLGIGTNQTAARKNAQGGHIDFGGDFGVALHFLRYLNPRGLTSFFVGAGSTFELLWFSAIRPEKDRYGNEFRNTLFGGGLDIDFLLGFEFMRASSVQFFLQAEAQLPAYVVQTEDDNVGSIHTWFPGLSLKLGVVF